MSKQTATNWLEKEFIKLEPTIGVHSKMYELLERAKEMEKQQIENAFCKGFLTEGDLVIICQQYIEETFNK